MTRVLNLALPPVLALVLLGSLGCLASRSEALNTGLQPPDFRLTTSPASLAMPVGSTAEVVVTLTSLSGFRGPVTLSLSGGLPAGITWSGSIAAGSGSGKLLIQVEDKVAPQVLDATELTGRSGELVHALALPLTLNPPLPAGNLRADLVQAGGGLQKGGPFTNRVLTQEPVLAKPASSASSTTQIQPGFDPEVLP